MNSLKKCLVCVLLFGIIMPLGTVSAAELPNPADVLVPVESELPDLPSPPIGADAGEELEGDFVIAEPFAVNIGTVYPGTISTTILDYFKGVMSNFAGDDYVCFRADQYNYYLFHGDDLSVSGTAFTGAGDYVRYNSSTGYVYRGSDTLSLNAVNGFVYSNLGDYFAAFDTERQVFNAKIIIYILVVLVCIWVFSKFFFWRKNR